MSTFLAACILLFSGAVRAQGAAAPQLGYVVRVDTQSVILDFNEKSGAVVGQTFTVFKEGDELKHPVTGASLGRMETKVAEGTLQAIYPMYSVGTFSIINAAPGTISVTDPNAPITPGMRARLLPRTAAVAQPPAATPAPPAQVLAPMQQPGATALARIPRWKGPAFDYQATAFTVGDCKGDGKLTAAVSDGSKVYLYPYPPQDVKPFAEFAHPGSAPRIYSLEAADLNGNGRAEVFASLYNESFTRFETVVLELGSDGKLAQIAEFPYLVRGYQDPAGKRVLAVQQMSDNSSSPFGAIYPLVYKDGKYERGKPAVKFVKNPVDWLYDFTFATFDNKPATIDVTNTELVRVRFAKGSFKTSETYCQTPNRKRWPESSDRMLNFRPAMAVRYDDKGFAGLYAVKNIGAYGGLALPFGIFSRAELHRLDYNGLSLAPSWIGQLGGYSTALAQVTPPGGTPELAVMVVGTAGKSAIWSFDP